MQEFTISSPQARNETTQDDELKKKVYKQQITSHRSTSTNNNYKANVEKGTNFKIISLIIILILIIIAIIYAYLSFKNVNENNNASKQDVLGLEMQSDATISEETVKNIPPSLKDKIFYTDDFNIYQSNKDGNNQVKLTDYTKFQGIKIKEIELLDEYNLGFFRCEENVFINKCQILIINLETQDIKIIRDINNDLQLQQLTWIDINKYAYTVKNSNINKLFIKYVNGIEEKQIAEIEIYETERRKFIEDDVQLRFSPNFDKIYYINTFARTGFDFLINIYDLNGNLLDQIEDATMPIWKDNDEIIYRKYSNNESGHLYIRDITKKQSINLKQSVEAAYNLRVLENSIIYWEANTLGKSYLYNLQEKENISFKDNSAFPIWLSKEEIILAKTRKCKQTECKIQDDIEFDTQFIIEEYYVYNLGNGLEEKINIDTRYLKNGIITWYNKHI